MLGMNVAAYISSNGLMTPLKKKGPKSFVPVKFKKKTLCALVCDHLSLMCPALVWSLGLGEVLATGLTHTLTTT